MTSGAVDALANRAILVNTTTAKSHHYAVGDPIVLKMQGGTAKLAVAGIFKASAAVPTS